MQRASISRFVCVQGGVAAIEMAFILPVLLIMLFGLIDATTALSDARRLSHSASVVAETVTRLATPATAAQIDDAFEAAGLLLRNAHTQNIRIEIHNYRLVNGESNLEWSHDNSVSGNCDDPVKSTLADLMTQGNDVIVAVVCGEHVPIMAGLISEPLLGNDAILLRRQFAMRMRNSGTFNCSNC
jgi:Flp pilus assembly protein TadG